MLAYLVNRRERCGQAQFRCDRAGIPRSFSTSPCSWCKPGAPPARRSRKYVEASPGTPLSREIAITAKDADATSFDAALHRMIDRVQPASVKTILKNLAQGERSSGEAEAFYSDQAEELR